MVKATKKKTIPGNHKKKRIRFTFLLPLGAGI
jgi:hypothetical protein